MPYKDPKKHKESCKKYREEHREELNEYNREYHKNNKEKLNKQCREYHFKNREEALKKRREWYLKNKEKIKEFRQSPEGKKQQRINNWKKQGILCYDFNLLYDLFLSTKNCEFCNCELTTDKRTTRTTRCLDHDHTITDKFNVRGVICNICNITDVLKYNL